MTIYTNTSTVSWPTMPFAQATRHSRLSLGYVFGHGQTLSGSHKEQTLATILDVREVSS